MTTQRLSRSALAAGVLCFLIGGGMIIARSLGAELGQELTVFLASLGLMLVAAGASMRRR